MSCMVIEGSKVAARTHKRAAWKRWHTRKQRVRLVPVALVLGQFRCSSSCRVICNHIDMACISDMHVYEVLRRMMPMTRLYSPPENILLRYGLHQPRNVLYSVKVYSGHIEIYIHRIPHTSSPLQGAIIIWPAILLEKVENINPKFKFRFLFFWQNFWHDFVTPLSTFANIKGSLLVLIRPRPIGCCDAGHDRQTKTCPVFGKFYANDFFEHRQKNGFFRARHLVLIYTPKEAHSRIFVTGGSIIA